MNKHLPIISALFIALMIAVPSVKAAQDNPSSEEITAYIIKEINQYRASFNLPPVQTSKETCDFAKIRAQEVAVNFGHEGFNRRAQNKTLPYGHWTAVTENLAMTSDYKQVVTMWAHSPGHAKNMRADTPYVCVKQYGNYFAYLAMKP